VEVCPRQKNCPITGKLAVLQKYISNYLKDITLEELKHSRGKKERAKKIKRRKR